MVVAAMPMDVAVMTMAVVATVVVATAEVAKDAAVMAVVVTAVVPTAVVVTAVVAMAEVATYAAVMVVVGTAVVATETAVTVVAVTEAAVLVVAETEALSMDRTAMVVEAVAAVVMEEAAMVEVVVTAVMVSCRNHRCSHHRCSRRSRCPARAKSCKSRASARVWLRACESTATSKRRDGRVCGQRSKGQAIALASSAYPICMLSPKHLVRHHPRKSIMYPADPQKGAVPCPRVNVKTFSIHFQDGGEPSAPFRRLCGRGEPTERAELPAIGGRGDHRL